MKVIHTEPIKEVNLTAEKFFEFYNPAKFCEMLCDYSVQTKFTQTKSLGRVKLNGFSFSRCQFEDDIWDCAEFIGCSFWRCTFDRCEFRKLVTLGSRFQWCRFAEVDFELSSLSNSTFQNCVFDDCGFKDADLVSTELQGSMFCKCDLRVGKLSEKVGNLLAACQNAISVSYQTELGRTERFYNELIKAKEAERNN